jgi:ribonucleoside-triphosphate reductase
VFGLKKDELFFRNILQAMDPDFSDYMFGKDYKLLEVDGITKINPFKFRKDYWSMPSDQVTINPNANLGNTGDRKNFCNLISEVSAPVNKLSALMLIRKYGNRRGNNHDGDDLVENIVNGALYHHNLTLYDLPYCIGLSLYPIISEGLCLGGLLSNPPHRPTSFVNIAVRFVQYASNHFAGATAITDFFLHYSYYTSQRKDYSDKKRENDLQNLIHGFTDEVRLSGQSPFTNLSLLSPETMRSMMGNYLWGLDTKVSDLMDEIMHNQLIYAKFFSQGQLGPDRKPTGLPYRFPITTLVADPSFEKEYPEVWNQILESNINLCYLNILNNMQTDLKSLSMCCRLTQNIEDLLKLNVNNTFGSYLSIGSHAVVSLNLPRIAHETKDEDKFMEILVERCEMARKLLLIHREEILQNRRLKYHWFFKTKKLDLKANFFSTIGFIGLANALEILGMRVTEVSGGLKFAKKVLQVLKNKSVEYSREDGYMYNIEEVPAEGASGVLALKDKMLYNGTHDYYDNQFVPLSYDISLLDRILIEGELQSYCTGGSIAHLNVDSMMEARSGVDFTERLLKISKLVHFALNKGFTVCSSGHVVQGIYQKCKECGSEDVDHVTRIVGYFAPTSSWNRAKQAEFKTRTWMKFTHV